MGGKSAEREVSLATGRPIAETLSSLGYNVVTVDADKDLPAALVAERIQFAFIALHGGKGENGAVQGLLEVMEIPYTGSGILASALAMDKVMSKIIFQAAGIRVPGYKVLETPLLLEEDNFSTSFFPLPLVVKPVNEGSSIGVSIVHSFSELKPAFENAFQYGRRLLVEEYIDGKEVHLAVLGNRVLGGVEVRPSSHFYNYECKYTGGMTEYLLPPDIDDALYERLKVLALSAHSAIGCRGYSRVDFRLNEKGDPFLLEVNTLPGMTPTSLLPKIASAAGIEFNKLLEEIIGASLEFQEFQEKG